VHYALDLLEKGEDSRQYKAVIVDETQDFSDQSLRLLRALVPERVNDMFLVGDAHQRIYQRTTSLKQCGINIIGRGRKLKINYRTTELIRRFATAMLEGIEFDDLDEIGRASCRERGLEPVYEVATIERDHRE